MPKISVIMPLYNAEKYVGKSIKTIINQTCSDFELIIVNDQSTDNSVDIVEKIHDSRIRLYHNETNKGIAYTRNRCIDLAQGDYIAIMDDDDLADFSRLEIESKYLDEHKDIDVVGAKYCEIDENDNITYISNEPLSNPHYIRAFLMLYNAVANGSAMMRREFIEKNKIRYDDNCYGMEDYKFWIDCSVNGKISNINQLLLYWRNSKTNETSRVYNHSLELRKRKFAELHKYAFEKNEFKLTAEEYDLINKLYPATISSIIASRYDIEMLYKIMQKIIAQAQSRNVVNAEEIVVFCRKMFSRRLEFSDLWY